MAKPIEKEIAAYRTRDLLIAWQLLELSPVQQYPTVFEPQLFLRATPPLDVAVAVETCQIKVSIRVSQM